MVLIYGKEFDIQFFKNESKERKVHFVLNMSRALLIFLLTLHFFSCKSPEFNNDCDPNSSFSDSTFTNLLSANQGSSYNPNLAKFLFPDLIKLCSGNSNNSSSNLSGALLTEFQFLGSENDLNADYKGVIEGNTINVNLPYGRVSRMIPNLKFNGVSANINGTDYNAGKNIIDFTSQVSINIRGANGQSLTYTVSTFLLRPIGDTNQGLCFIGGGTSSCASASATDPKQDGLLDGFPYPRGIQGSSILGSYSSDPVNLDKLSGLVWKTCEEGQTGNDCSGGTSSTITHSQATTLCDNLNTMNGGLGYAGLKKWRLPTWQELSQVMDHGTANNLWNTTQFPSVSNAIAANRYRWTSSLILPAGTSAMGLNELHSSQSLGGSNPVRCVSGDTPPNFEYTDNGDGTVLDRRTKLIIQKCANGQTFSPGVCAGALGTVSWSAGLLYCNSLTLAGKSWRMPNLNEIVSLMDMSKTTPFFDTTIFPNQSVGDFHSSTTQTNNFAYDNILTINTPIVGGISGKGVPENVKCVSGP